MDGATELAVGMAPRAGGLRRVRATWAGAAWLGLLVGVLVSPPIVYRIVLGSGGRLLDTALLWSMGMSLLWVATLHAFFRRPVWLHLLLAPLYFAVAMDLFLVFEFGSRLTTSYLSIIVTDHSETGEFLHAYARPVAIGVALLVATWGLGLWGIRRVELRWPRWAPWLGITLLVLGYGIAVARQMRTHGMNVSRAVLDVASHDYSSPVGAVSQLGVTAALLAETHRFLEARRSFAFGATKAPGDAPEVYVLAIGESSRPDRWSLNGYARETTPRLARTPNLVSFSDVVTTSPTTAYAVPSLLSLAPISDWPAVQSQKSIIGAFREAGFQTWWLSAQEVSHWGGIIPVVAEEAHRRRYYDRSLDRALVDDLQRVLADPERPRRILVVLHTRGSHFEFSTRYPAEYRVFPEKVATHAEYLSNTYDNSVLYTDRILSDVIEAVRALRVRAAVAFVSDHGENLMDDERRLFGHAIGNEYDMPAAAFVWWSDELAAAEPAKVESARRARAAPLTVAHFAHSLVDLAGIEARGLDAGKSVFSGRLRDDPRAYLSRGKLAEWRGAPRGAAAGAGASRREARDGG
jgi:heptose-I-phosphate ethanolaminephosphotransferase